MITLTDTAHASNLELATNKFGKPIDFWKPKWNRHNSTIAQRKAMNETLWSWINAPLITKVNTSKFRKSIRKHTHD